MKRYLIVLTLFIFLGAVLFISRSNFTPGTSSLPTPTLTGANQNILTKSEAKQIAQNSCIKGSEALAEGYYNEFTKTWWFDANLNTTKEGCNPACVVSEETKTAEINWRCTGLQQPVNEEETLCRPESRGKNVCAEIYEPVCATVEIQCIKAPCEPIKETYPNLCRACSNQLVKSYVNGVCPQTTSKEVIITELFEEKYPNQKGKIAVNIGQEDNEHARGSVSFGNEGGIFLAAIVNGSWQLVHDGNGAIPCTLSKYGFPQEMLSDCN